MKFINTIYVYTKKSVKQKEIYCFLTGILFNSMVGKFCLRIMYFCGSRSSSCDVIYCIGGWYITVDSEKIIRMNWVERNRTLQVHPDCLQIGKLVSSSSSENTIRQVESVARNELFARHCADHEWRETAAHPVMPRDLVEYRYGRRYQNIALDDSKEESCGWIPRKARGVPASSRRA